MPQTVDTTQDRIALAESVIAKFTNLSDEEDRKLRQYARNDSERLYLIVIDALVDRVAGP